MKFRILPFILSIITLSCSKKEETIIVQEQADMPFVVGLYDEHDYHYQYATPFEIPQNSGLGVDLEGDGEADFFLWLNSYFGNLRGESTIEFRNDWPGINPWEIAAVPFMDSVFYCSDSTSSTPHSSNFYYNQSAQTCTGTKNEFVYYRQIGDQPIVLNRGAQFQTIPSWQDQAILHHYEFRQSPTHYEEFRLPLYHQLNTEHYLSLRRILGQDTLYAWLKVQVDASEFPWKVSLNEYALRKVGTR